MSVSTAVQGALFETASAGPIWRAGFANGNVTVNEGDTVTFSLQLLNPQVGAQFVWAMYKSSGDALGASNFVESFSTCLNRACNAHGLKVTTLSDSTVPKRTYTADYMIQMLPGSTYQGEMINFDLIVRKNHKDDINPRSAVFVQTRKVNATDPDFVRNYSNILTINDTSRTPTGTPTYALVFTALDGVSSAKSNFPLNDGVKVTIHTQNMLSGTKIKLYIANAAQYYLVPSFRSSLSVALKNPPQGITYEETKYPPPTGQVWYNGYTIVYGDDYQGADLSFNCIVGQVNDDGSAAEFDIISTIAAEGTVSDMDTTLNRGTWDSSIAYNQRDFVTYTPDGLQYVAIQGTAAGIAPGNESYWRPYQATLVTKGSGTFFAQQLPPRYWEVRSTTDRTNISYKINVPAKVPGASVQLSAINAPAGFIAALTAAASAANSPASFDGLNLVTNANATPLNQTINFTVPHAGTGKHRLVLSNSDGQAPITIGESMIYLSAITVPAEPTYIVGVNNAVGEFGTVPGQYISDYEYPSVPQAPNARAARPHDAMDYLWGMGFKIFRLPFRWGRIQRDGLYTPLSGEKDPSVPWDQSPYDIARIDEIVNYWTAKGGIVLLDMHNYGAGPTSNTKIGWALEVPVDAWIDCWIRIVNRYLNNNKVWFGLMNEPTGAGWGAWSCRENMQWMVNAIRGRTTSTNKILVAGQRYSSAMQWVGGGQGDAYVDFYDPANNFAFEPHCYFDSDGSGTKGTCVTGAEVRTNDIVNWATTYGFKIFFGEIAGGNPSVSGSANCRTVTINAYNYLKANKQAVLGWTTWGYGPKWPASYMFLLSPNDYTSYTSQQPCMDMLVPYITREG